MNDAYMVWKQYFDRVHAVDTIYNFAPTPCGMHQNCLRYEEKVRDRELMNSLEPFSGRARDAGLALHEEGKRNES